MGRLEHLTITLPVSLSHEDAEVILVDYSCPEHAGDWAEESFPAEVKSGKLKVYRVLNRVEYCTSHAKNVAHVRAGGAILVNADADNFIDVDYLKVCADLFSSPEVQLVYPEPWNSLTASCGMFGRIAMRRSAFHALGGYDEDMVGWGGRQGLSKACADHRSAIQNDRPSIRQGD